MNPPQFLKKLFQSRVQETTAGRLSRHLDALKKRPEFFVFDGTMQAPLLQTHGLKPERVKIGAEEATVYSIQLIRYSGRNAQDGDRVVLEDGDGVKRLFVLYDDRLFSRYPAQSPLLRAAPLDGEYHGGFGFQGAYKSEFTFEAAQQEKKGTDAAMVYGAARALRLQQMIC